MKDFTIRQVSERLGTSKKYIADQIKQGASPNHYICTCPHKTIMIPESDLCNFKIENEPGRAGPRAGVKK